MVEIATGEAGRNNKERELHRRLLGLASSQTDKPAIRPDPEIQSILDELISRKESPAKPDGEGPPLEAA